MLVCGEGKGQSPPQTWGVERVTKEEEGRRGGRKEELSHLGVPPPRRIRLQVLQTTWLKSSQNSFSSPN